VTRADIWVRLVLRLPTTVACVRKASWRRPSRSANAFARLRSTPGLECLMMPARKSWRTHGRSVGYHRRCVEPGRATAGYAGSTVPTANNDENGSVARFFAWLISICAWSCSDTIWLLDLLQGTSGRQPFCAIVIGIEHDQLRGGGLGTDKHSKRYHACGSETMEGGSFGCLQFSEMRDEIGRPGDVAGLQPARHKVVAATSARTCSISAWSALEEAAVKASATSPRPSSNRRLPRRDWQ